MTARQVLVFSALTLAQQRAGNVELSVVLLSSSMLWRSFDTLTQVRTQSFCVVKECDPGHLHVQAPNKPFVNPSITNWAACLLSC